MPTFVTEPAAVVQDLARVIRAARTMQTVRACLVTTRDREQAISIVVQSAADAGIALYHYTVAARRRYDRERLTWKLLAAGDPDPAALLGSVSETQGGGVFIIEDCVPMLRDEGGDRAARMKLAEMLSASAPTPGIVLVFVEPPEAASRLPALLSEQIVKLNVPYPRADELRLMAREEIALVAHQTKTIMSVDSIRDSAEALTDGLVGTTRKAAQDVLRDALCEAPGNCEAAAGYLKKRKVERLSRDLAMNVLDTDTVEMPIGLDNLMEYLAVHKDHMRMTGNGRARGVLLVGPPGTGKTMLARAVGNVVGLPVVEFRISSLMNSLLGETERRFAQAFATLEALAPSVVFIDEIEKAFGDSSERDGGTMMRTTGALLSWLSDNPYPNYILATCNSLTRMGEIGLTMTRSERFDAAYFVDVPAKDARIQMMERWLKDRIPSASLAARQLAEETDKFSGADLYSLIKQAAARAEHAGQTLTLEHLREEAVRKHPRVLALYEEFRDLRRWGSTYCEPAGPTNQ